jgi:hypothetical protein
MEKQDPLTVPNSLATCALAGAKTPTGLSTVGAAEFRQDELMCVAAGYSLPGDKLFRQLKFPEQIAQ